MPSISGTAEIEDLELEEGFDDEPEVEPVRETAKTTEKAEPAKKDAGSGEVERLRAQIAESEANAKYWHEQAKSTRSQPAAPAKAAAPKKLSDDPVEAISSGDPERMRKMFGELGFVSQDEVDQRVNAKANTVLTEQQLYQDHPELRDQNSPFFKATAAEYQRLASDPVLAQSPNLMKIAAELAAAKTGKGRAAMESEEERAARVSRQSGDRGRRPSGRAAGDPEELSASQRGILAKFQAAGAPLTEEGFKKRAKAGVGLGGALGALASRRAR